MEKTDVCFVGLGYIGLPTAVVMANAGVNVVGFDINASAVEQINRGKVTIVEPGLEEALGTALRGGRFRASTEPVPAKTYVIAVPTPFTNGYECDMRFIYSAAETIAPFLTGDELIILESTSPPLTTAKLAARIAELREDLDTTGKAQGDTHQSKRVLFAHCPERILPGRALEELVTNDRIIGGMTPEATQRAKELYQTFCQGQLLETNDRTAELSKLAENAYRDVNIAFANELSLIADGLDIDVWELIGLANHHPRVNILQPGPGVGGHCIAVDPWFIVSSDPENSRLIRTAREVNDGKPEWVINAIKERVSVHKATEVALLGLAFKADIDDLRESPALAIAQRLLKELPEVNFTVIEPNISALPDVLRGHPNVKLGTFPSDLREDAITVLLVDHKEFGTQRPARLSAQKVVDTRGIWRQRAEEVSE
ncbi:UDP-N-acetyl-D-mannosamine dehydrogenase [Corynebacterium lizhenjunii]|uniref:UDP-N-acetyl-D-mannosamine dehydrogenase n=1 Tax=Corynebacterium lizhenjunii TaxID=2709394 RepID=A0A7T0KDJ8_9CORY|nr:UDP-N-acetyl-D-mannosamine dehydrogenase [Corynebacterium lizhenjunii]QPK78592.1 UDP-N-acetyl-D-mannosamine dehydrogenase [Corynebacterium lizhenjunii]